MIVNSLLVKLASRCNLKCKYCYWFRDESVYSAPPKLTVEAENALIEKLNLHILQYKLSDFQIIFHGGEPLLFGKKRFIEFLSKLEVLMKSTKCLLGFAITTNGVLIDDDWAKLFRIFRVKPSISIDGSPEVHDKNRIDLKGRGTYYNTIKGISILRKNNIEPGIISVCAPYSSPSMFLKTIVDDLLFNRFDILIPDANYENSVDSIKHYYMKLIELWFEKYAKQGVRIRILDGMIAGLLGYNSRTHSVGTGAISTVVINTDGGIEPLDVLRMAGHDKTKTPLNIICHSIQDIVQDKNWRLVYDNSINLPDLCNDCRYKKACGGGHIAHRWSKQNGYNNPSVYCSDYKNIFNLLVNKIKSSEYRDFLEEKY